MEPSTDNPQPARHWSDYLGMCIFPGIFLGFFVYMWWTMPPEAVNRETTTSIVSQRPSVAAYVASLEACDTKSPDQLHLHRCRHNLLMQMTDEAQIAAALAYEREMVAAYRAGKVYRNLSMERN